jgi:hypothetical protein
MEKAEAKAVGGDPAEDPSFKRRTGPTEPGSVGTLVDPSVPATPTDTQLETESKKMAEKGDERKKITEFTWLFYPPGSKAINYLKDFMLIHRKDRIYKKKLGLEVEKNEEVKPASNDPLGKRDPGFSSREMPNSNSGTKKLMDVADDLQERLVKFGRLCEDDNVIKRKQHNNFDYYEQDDFIDDPEDPNVQQSMERLESKYEDYFVVRGNVEGFKKSKRFNDRVGEVKNRNRINKAEKQEELKKKREEMQMKVFKKPEPAEDGKNKAEKNITNSSKKSKGKTPE